MKLWDIAIRQPVFMTMILVAGLVLGGISYVSMPVDLFPDVDFPVVVVTTVYPGASPEEVERQVTEIIEEELSAVAGLDEITSISAESVSTVILLFDLDAEAARAAQDVREEVGLLRNRLPSDVEDPVVRRFNPTAAPIMLLAVADRTGRTPPVELRAQVEDRVQTPLLRLDGVGEVEVNGGQSREIRVELNREAMEARRITNQDIARALQASNLNIPGGSLVQNDTKLLLRTPGEFKTVAEIPETVIRQSPTAVYLRDVARVIDDFETRDVITRLNGAESIVLSVQKASGSNTLRTSELIQEEIGKVRQANPDWDIVIGGDLADQIRSSADGATEDLLWGALLASLVILFFFRDIRSTLITVAGLPVILISSLFFMQLLDISLNQVSLLALALVVGLVIDDAIVVRENIMRWIERGHSPRVAASQGTAEVLLPVLATSATILAVFLPVAYAQGIIGRFFRDFGLTVAIAIVVSTFESLTMAPMLSAYFFKQKKVVEGVDESAIETAGTSRLDRLYSRILNFGMDHKWVVIVGALLVIAGSVVSLQYIEQAFLPQLDQGQFNVSMELPAGTPLSVTEREALKVEEILRSHPNVEAVFTTIGETSNSSKATWTVQVLGGVESDISGRAIIEELRPPLAAVPNIAFQVTDDVTGGDSFVGARDIIIEMVSLGGSFIELGEEAQTVAAQLEQIDGLTDIEVSYRPGQPEVQVAIDPARAAAFGMTTAQIGSTLRSLVDGQVVGAFRGEGAEADIRVILAPSERDSVEDILDLQLAAPSGQFVPVRNVASAIYGAGPTQIQRVDRQPTVSIGVNVSGRDLPDATTEVTAFLSTLTLPPNVEIGLGGDAEIQAESFTNLSLALLLSVVFVYMALASQFGSFVQPIIIMLAMPLSIIGAILALVATGRPLDMTAFIGFIMLMGLVTKNSILLVDFANKARAEGYSADEAMRIAGPIRLRPILMTAFSLILAMTPVVLGLGAAGEFRSPMGTAIMGGMLTSTFLTLMVVPVGYSLVVGALDRLGARIAPSTEETTDLTPVLPTAESYSLQHDDTSSVLTNGPVLSDGDDLTTGIRRLLPPGAGAYAPKQVEPTMPAPAPASPPDES